MALSPKDVLSALQWDFLSGFFNGAPPFFLTGETALSAFYLRHRYSEDLDLFTLDNNAFDRVPLYVADTATKLTASVASLQIAPQFRRYRLSRNGESVIVDFVREVVPQISEEKNRFDGIVVDTLDDITANKICAVIGRAGYALENYIRLAERKDAGVSQAMVAYLLSEIRLLKVPDYMIAPISIEDVQEYFRSLARKLAVESFPR
jgi:hypothetical protein